MLRHVSCCPCELANTVDLVAINKTHEGDLERVVCTGNEACGKCVPQFQEGTRAVCDTAAGHCAVTGLDRPVTDAGIDGD